MTFSFLPFSMCGACTSSIHIARNFLEIKILHSTPDRWVEVQTSEL